MSKVLVSDTSIWIALYRANALDVAFRLPYQFVTTDFAFEELKNPDGRLLKKLGLKVVNLSEEEVIELFSLNQQWRKPSLPDISCYLYARKNENCVLLTGDAELRKHSIAMRVETHGVLWILDEMVRCKITDKKKASKYLRLMIDAGNYLPAEECEKRLGDWAR